MNLLERLIFNLANRDQIFLELAKQRGFVVGQGVISPSDQYFGRQSDRFQPERYGDYLETSNGVYVCSTLRAELLSSLELELYKLNARGEKTKVEAGNLYALLQKVNPFWTFNRLMSMTELSLCAWGEAFWFLERGENRRSVPQEIWWARPDRVRVFPHPEKYIDHFEYWSLNANAPIRFENDEVIWFRFPNPIDEFEGLSPLGAASISADYAISGLKSNINLFNNGMQVGGIITPPEGKTWTLEQAESAEDDISRRLKGVDRAHRWIVFRQDAQMKEAGFNPREAEFVEGLKFSLEEIARAYRVPLDLIGGQRTYENYNSALRAVWTQAILPEARFIATELTEQLLPMFGEADLCEFDDSEIDALQEAEDAEWQRAKEQIQVGVMTINEWRDEEGLEPLPWGDAWWTGVSNVPVTSAEKTDAVVPPENKQSAVLKLARVFGVDVRQIEFGSDEHQRMWNRFLRRAEPHEKRFAKFVTELFKRQTESIQAKLKQRAEVRAIDDELFAKAQWVKTFRQEARPLLLEILRQAGLDALNDVNSDTDFSVDNPNVVRFLERRAQRFAKEVNDTTWDELKKSLSEGIQAGENITQLSERVDNVMDERIRSSAETIARTEVIGASNGGTLLAYQQSGVVKAKRWLAALDERTRDTHVQAHNQEVALDADFQVGAGNGQAPGQIGLPEEDINCRCTITAVLD